MASKLSDLFLDSGGAPIDLDGQIVHMMHEFPQSMDGREITVQFEQVTPTRTQAIRIRVHGGVIDVNGEQLENVVFWSDTAPKTIEIAFRSTQAHLPVTVTIWNAWRDGMGSTQAWIGNSGMLVEQNADGSTILRCSDGYGEPNFDDLVVSLR